MEREIVYCDECRVAYPLAACADSKMPCGHPVEVTGPRITLSYDADGVETLRIQGWRIKACLQIRYKPDDDAVYDDGLQKLLEGMEVKEIEAPQVRDHEPLITIVDCPEWMELGAWLSLQSECLIRTVLSRWKIVDCPPVWRALSLRGVATAGKLMAKRAVEHG